MNTPLSTFPAPLLRLILCGGGGLAPAWGPIISWDGHLWTLDRSGFALRMVMLDGEPIRSGVPVLERPALWSLPIDAASPWPARLALVAAWIARADKQRIDGAGFVLDEPWWRLYSLSDGLLYEHTWRLDDGGNIEPCDTGFDLPTLPQHIQTHHPAVALVLALWDVPEIRARIEAP